MWYPQKTYFSHYISIWWHMFYTYYNIHTREQTVRLLTAYKYRTSPAIVEAIVDLTLISEPS
jgi:hypothetical protein